MPWRTIRSALSVSALSMALLCAVEAATSEPMNVLFIVVDDLRVDLASYGIKNLNISTPNLDKLAASSVQFQRAYIQQAVCGPSRNSFMSGRRPDETKTWNFKDNFREAGVGKDWVTLPQHFKNSGYLTTGMGKLYHPNSPPRNDEPKSWSPGFSYFAPNAQIKGCNNNPTKGVHNVTCFCEGSDCVDWQIATHAVERIGNLTAASPTAAGAASAQPWFLGVGFHKPHPDWMIPQQYWDAVDPAGISMPAHPTAPTGMPPQAFYSCAYLAEHSDFQGQHVVPSAPLSPALVRKVRHAYYAGVQFMDAMVGRVLDALEASGQANRTIVSFHSDHGWQLGEHGIFCKQTNFELATRVPLLIRDPAMPASARGRKETALVEVVSMYKTLSDLAGLPAPEAGVQGTSLAPLIRGGGTSAAGAVAAADTSFQYAFSQYPRCGPAPRSKGGDPWSNPCTQTARDDFVTMGFSVRSDAWRYTEWRAWHGKALAADWSSAPAATELYAHTGDDGTDLDAFENDNVAADPGNAGTVAMLAAALKAQFAPSH